MMLWTLVAFLGIVSILLVRFLTSLIDKIKDKYFVYPSDAVIDQVLPMEITEHVMTFLDPNGLMQCRFVSKYWRYHATKKSTKKIVMNNYDNNLKELPLDFPLAAPIKTDFRDRAVAGRYNKILLHVDDYRLPALTAYFESRKSETSKYAVKTTMSKAHLDHSFSANSIGWTLSCTPPTDPLPDTHWQDTPYYSRTQVVFDLADFFNEQKRRGYSQKLYSYRELDTTEYFWFVPLNHRFLQVLLFILAPLVVRDVLFTPSYLKVIKQWFGPVMFIVSFCMNGIVLRDSMRYAYAAHPTTKFLMTGFTALYAVLTWWTYPYSSSYFAFTGLIGFSFAFVILLHDYTFSGIYANFGRLHRRYGPFIIAVVLVLVMNDWKLAVECIKDASIWFRAFDNTVFYAIFMVNFIILNFFSHLSRSPVLRLSHLIDWDAGAVKLLAKSYLFVVLFTLYAPSWKGNHV